MSHHTPSAQEGPANSPVDAIVKFLHELLRPLPGQNEELAAPRRRGRPRDLQSDHLWLAMLVAILRGFTGFAPVWRLITWTGSVTFRCFTSPEPPCANAWLVNRAPTSYGTMFFYWIRDDICGAAGL